ncbi:MAG: Type secretion signal domain [Fluviicola sp.]|jgi:hypothetical protein|uniref:T9SS type B sorting domain-containing protein n=1 Tax=Fluviicola sp. TaxID=1917219 RepID=UPI00262EF72A|nr:gliding motility-associated C-terminal domain-containing protein [Fluviicola sp.]MDF3026868.1 Type secretion signal domain [Fluviicola sp.]
MKKFALLIVFLAFCGILSAQTSTQCVIKAPSKLEKEADSDQIQVHFESTCPLLELEIKVISRWGNVLYISNQLDHLWQGQEKNPGTYFFTIKGTFQDGSKIDQNGFFQLL